MAVFAAIIDEGSLSAAGRRLHLPLATVSRKLSDLESHLNTRLLTRSTRRLVLTDAGSDYLAACRQILDQVDEAERAAAGAYSNARGELVIAAPVLFGRIHVTPVVTMFLERYAEVDVRLILGDRNINLLEEHVDLAIRVGELPDSNLIAKSIGRVQRVVVASPDYLARFGTPTQAADLTAHRCITFEGLMASSSWSFTQGSAELRVPIHSRLSVNTGDAAIAAAELGLGITRVLSYQVADALKNRRLIRLLIQDEPAALPVNLIYSRQGRLPMKIRAFIDFSADRLRERIAD